MPAVAPTVAPTVAPRPRSSSADSRTKRTPEQRRKDEAGIDDVRGAAAAPASGAAAAAPPAGGEEPAAAPAFAEPAPSPQERRRDGMVRGLRADAD